MFAVKKAYYKLSLQVHPDRVSEAEKEAATEKFKILTKIHGVLTDSNKKALYDEQGIIDDDGDADLSNSAWLEMWRQFFKPITTTDIEKYEKEYVGSEMEKTDIRKAYLNGKGCWNYMLECVPFMKVEDEPRILLIVKGELNGLQNRLQLFQFLIDFPQNGLPPVKFPNTTFFWMNRKQSDRDDTKSMLEKHSKQRK